LRDNLVIGDQLGDCAVLVVTGQQWGRPVTERRLGLSL